MDTFLAEPVNVGLKVSTCILPEHLLQDSEGTLEINGRARLEGLEWFNDLDSQPIVFKPDFANNHFIESL